MSTFGGRPVALPDLRGEDPWQATHGMDVDKENPGTPSKRAGDAAKSPASVSSGPT